jgi:hypothetical protein
MAWLSRAALVAAYTLLACFETGIFDRVATDLFRHIDPIQDAWILHTVTGNLLRDPLHLFAGNNFHPVRDPVLLCDPLLGPAVLVAPLRLVTDNPALLYNAAVLASLVLASLGFHGLARRLWDDPRAALLAGIAIPYAAQRTAHIYQLNLLTVAGYAFFLTAVLGLLEAPTLGRVLGAGAAFALQAATSGYHALNLVLVGLVVAAWGWRRLRRPATLLAGATAALLALGLLWPYISGFRAHRVDTGMSRSLDESAGGNLTLGPALLSTNALVWRRLLPEGDFFPGLTVAVLAGVGLWRQRGPNASLLALLAAVSFAAALGPELRVMDTRVCGTPYAFLFSKLPFLSAARRPILFAAPGLMAVGLLAAGGLAAIPALRRPALLSLVLGAVAAETLVPRFGRADPGTQLPEVYRNLLGRRPGGVLEIPIGVDPIESQYQWWSIRHGLPIVNGMAAFYPDKHLRLHQQVRFGWSRPPGEMRLEQSFSLGFLKTHFPIRHLVLHAGTDTQTIANVEAAHETFRLIHETEAGDRIYSVRRWGVGRRIRRVFAEDDLRGASVRARLLGPAGARVTVRLNGQELGRHALSGTVEETAWRPTPSHVVRGPNLLELEVDREELRLLDIDTEPDVRDGRAGVT